MYVVCVCGEREREIEREIESEWMSEWVSLSDGSSVFHWVFVSLLQVDLLINLVIEQMVSDTDPGK